MSSVKQQIVAAMNQSGVAIVPGDVPDYLASFIEGIGETRRALVISKLHNQSASDTLEQVRMARRLTVSVALMKALEKTREVRHLPDDTPVRSFRSWRRK